MTDLPLRVGALGHVFVVLDAAFAGFQGHFPGEPVLPAMCQVDLAVRAASLVLGKELDLAEVERARFLRRVLPGEELRMTVTAQADGRVLVRSYVGDEPAADLALGLTPRASS